MNRIFVDTYALVAMHVTGEGNHARVAALMDALLNEGARFVTTDAVLTEFCNGLAKASLRGRAALAVRAYRSRDDVEIIHITREIFDRAFALYESRPDKDWGLTDCMSFEMMKSQRIKEAITADHHFGQAGFKTLM